MADAKLTPRQLVDVLHRLDAIETHSKHVRAHLIEAMASRRGNGQAAGREAPPRTPAAVKRRRE